MERSSALSTAEIIGVAAASAAALGSVIVALGRSQSSGDRDKAQALAAAASNVHPADGVERGRELARSAVSSLTAAYPDLREGANELVHRFAESARPQAARVKDSAATTGEQVRATGATVLERLQEDVLPAASTAVAGLVDRVGEARERSTPVAGDVKSTAVNVKAAAARKADKALTTSTSAAKDTISTLAWLTAASAIIYLVILTPERREQLKSFLWGVFDQVTVLLEDFSGEEEEF